MGQSSSVRRRLYLDTKDALEEVGGISRRQLGHWEDKGLLKPELGPDSKRYTEKDLARLKVLKKLIVDQRLPLDFVGQLAERSDADFMAPELGATQYLDIVAGTMKSKSELSDELWQEFLVAADETELEQRLYDLWLVLGRLLRQKYRTDASYQNRRDEIRRFEAGKEFTSRIEWEANEKGEYRPTLSPYLEKDGYSIADLMSWVKSSGHTIVALQAVGDRLWSDGSGDLSWDQYSRLWGAQTIKAINEMNRPRRRAIPSPSEDIDDVPF